jgi:hypothetical protein
VTHGARALAGAYAATADGVLKFYGKFPADLPMYMLFLMILGAAGALGAIISILDQGGQLDRAFGRPTLATTTWPPATSPDSPSP